MSFPDRSLPYSSSPVRGTYAVTREGSGAWVVELSGDLDGTFNARLRNLLVAALNRRIDRLTIDLAGVTFVDAAVLRTLMTIRRRCAASGTQMTLRRPGRRVERLLAATRLDRLFEIEDRLPALG